MSGVNFYEEWVDRQPEDWIDLDNLRTARRNRLENAVHAAADQHLEVLLTTMTQALAYGRTAVDWPALKKAVAGRDQRGAERAVAGAASALQARLRKVLPAVLLPVLISGGDAGLGILLRQKLRAAYVRPTTLAPRMRFDGKNEEAQAWAREHAAELARDLSETTRHDIAEALVDAFESGNMGDLEERITLAVGDEARAELIARTEVMKAANEGQRQAWNQAVDEGLLEGNERRVWIATEGSACPICEELDGKTAKLGEEYPDPGGDGPPQHPNCRCSEGIYE